MTMYYLFKAFKPSYVIPSLVPARDFATSWDIRILFISSHPIALRNPSMSTFPKLSVLLRCFDWNSVYWSSSLFCTFHLLFIWRVVNKLWIFLFLFRKWTRGFHDLLKGGLFRCSVRPWRWRQNFPPKRWYVPERLYDIESQKTIVWSITFLKTQVVISII
jgi:hypothetical protein